MCKSRSRKGLVQPGFTLVELLVVVGIIAVLVGILLPALARAREHGNRIKCLSNMRQIGMAIQSYLNDNRQIYPAPAAGGERVNCDDWIFWNDFPSGWTVESGTRNPSDGRIVRYLGPHWSEAIFQCPSDTLDRSVGNGRFRHSYSVNEWVFQPRIPNTVQVYDGKIDIPFNPDQKLILKHTMIRRPSEKIIMVDEASYTIDDGCWSPVDGLRDMNPNAKNQLANRHDRNADERVNETDVKKRLVGRGNVLFADFHADYVERKSAMDPNFYEPLRSEYKRP